MTYGGYGRECGRPRSRPRKPLYAKGVVRDGAASGTACRRFEYRVMLPGQADPDKITASLADGVLTVAVPEAEAGKPRRSEITG
jgi:HSP20 family protein